MADLESDHNLYVNRSDETKTFLEAEVRLIGIIFLTDINILEPGDTSSLILVTKYTLNGYRNES